MMFLLNGIRAEVEPVPGRKGWYQLTGQHITRWTSPVAETAADLEGAGVKVTRNAKLLGIHNVEPEIAQADPRFNGENAGESTSFCVFTDERNRRTYMLLAVNQPEYAILRFLVPHESGPEFDEAAETYCVEPRAVAT